MGDELEAARRRAVAATYDRAAEHHEQTAAFYHGLGDDERADVELRIAKINREAAEEERETATAFRLSSFPVGHAGVRSLERITVVIPGAGVQVHAQPG